MDHPSCQGTAMSTSLEPSRTYVFGRLTEGFVDSDLHFAVRSFADEAGFWEEISPPVHRVGVPELLGV